jgi:hypothetical protein
MSQKLAGFAWIRKDIDGWTLQKAMDKIGWIIRRRMVVGWS